MKSTALIFALFLASTVTFAQDAYRCNVGGVQVIQESPCKVSTPAKPVRQITSAPVSATPAPKPPIDVKLALRESNNEEREKGLALCKLRAPNRVVWKDPDSVKVGFSHGGDIVDVSTQPGAKGRRYYIGVNAKNSYGGYIGEKSIICYTNFEGDQILDIDSILLK